MTKTIDQLFAEAMQRLSYFINRMAGQQARRFLESRK